MASDGDAGGARQDLLLLLVMEVLFQLCKGAAEQSAGLGVFLEVRVLLATELLHELGLAGCQFPGRK